MSTSDTPAPPAVSGVPAAEQASAAALVSENAGRDRARPPVTPLKPGYLAVLVLSYFALYVAWIAPTAFSLAIRVEQIDPAGKNTAVALAVGLPSLLALVSGPVVGVLSDRTTVRLGKRRTWMLVGLLLGLVGAAVVGLAGSIPVLVAGWVVAFIGYTTTGGMFVTHLGDRVPDEQQGRVAGFTGSVTQIAPILGVAMAGAFSAHAVLMFVIPAVFAFVLGLVFVVVMKDSPAERTTSRLDWKALLQGYWFNPRRHPDFAWVWISRCLIFLALSVMSIYNVYLLRDRLGLDTSAVAALVSTAGMLGIVAAVTGAMGSGALSDRLGRRKPFIVGAGLLMAVGLVTTATMQSLPQYFIGSVVTVFGVGIFGSIDQAIGLNTLPKEEGQNGRFIGIFNLANQLAQGVGPFFASLVVTLAGGDYAWVYLVAAALAVTGALLILPVRAGRTSAAAVVG